MSRIRVNAYSISLDGFGAGPDQSIDDPLGRGAEALHHWMFETSLFSENGTGGVDDHFARRSMAGLGAWILGRNMFGPIRGPWPDDRWKGWWGDDPPYHVPVFVLTHHSRPPIEMKSGTIFHFVTDGIESALDSALEAASVEVTTEPADGGTRVTLTSTGLVRDLTLLVDKVDPLLPSSTASVIELGSGRGRSIRDTIGRMIRKCAK